MMKVEDYLERVTVPTYMVYYESKAGEWLMDPHRYTVHAEMYKAVERHLKQGKRVEVEVRTKINYAPK